jgi:hypothetical protein
MRSLARLTSLQLSGACRRSRPFVAAKRDHRTAAASLRLAAVTQLSRQSSLKQLQIIPNQPRPGNFLKALPETVGLLTDLKHLDLSKNSLPTLCNGLGALTGLESLDLASNQLLALPRCLGHLSGLRRLVLSHNWLSGAAQMAEVCEGWGGLTELRLANGGLLGVVSLSGGGGKCECWVESQCMNKQRGASFCRSRFHLTPSSSDRTPLFSPTTVSDKNGALVVPAAAFATHCPDLRVLDLSAQFSLDTEALEGLSVCARLSRLELPWPLAQQEVAGRLKALLPGLVVA